MGNRKVEKTQVEKRRENNWTALPSDENVTGFKTRVIMCPLCGKIPMEIAGRCAYCGSLCDE